MRSERETSGARDADFFVFRSPTLPIDVLTGLSEGLVAADVLARGGDLDAALACDHARVAAKVLSLVSSDAVVREAIHLASHSVSQAIEAWRVNERSARAVGAPSIALRYLVRMASRATPFGLFAGLSLGRTAEETTLRTGPRADYARHTRLDMRYLTLLCEALERRKELRAALRYRPSSGAYATAGQIRYPEASTDASTGARSYALVSVDRNPHLDLVLSRAGDGATPDALARALTAADPELSTEEAAEFVDELIDAQLVTSDLTPPITMEPLDATIATLRDCREAAAETVLILRRAKESMRAMDASGLGLPPERYGDVATALRELPCPTDPGHLFQVDLYKPAPEARLGRAVLVELERGVQVLSRICAPGSPDLDRFRAAFLDRYEQREVPLVEAMDEESGVGFQGSLASSREPAALLRGLPFPVRDRGRTVAFGAREEHLLRRVTEAASSGAVEWALTPADVDALASPAPVRLPDSFAVLGSIAAKSSRAIDEGAFRVAITTVTGPSAAYTLGRFCLGHPELSEQVAAHLRAEEACCPDAIFAEIVHLPEGRAGNIIARPALRPYEIEYLGRGSAQGAHRIPVADLRVSVRADRVVLTSVRLGREIKPRLTCAHHHARASLGIYRFLCALQEQDTARTMAFGWGPLLGAPFLPRVVAGRCVLARAQWSLSRQEVASLDRETPAARFRALAALRERWRIPRWVTLLEGDNALVVDLESALHVESLNSTIAGRAEAVTLSEMFPSADELPLEGPEGRFAHEVVIPFVRRPTTTRATDGAARPALTRAECVERTFAPGSQWVYAKLYGGTATLDRVLVHAIGPLVERLRARGTIDRWFFLRYNDPHPHLRVRLRGTGPASVAEILRLLHELCLPLTRSRSLWRIGLDTYEREVERYGGDAAIELAERVFEADSDAALAIVAAVGADVRWRMALRGCHLLLVDLGYDSERRASLVEQAREAFGREHLADTALERQMGARFRIERARLELLVAPRPEESDDTAPAAAELARRSAAIAPVAEQLRALEARGALRAPMVDVVRSYLHMHCNRVLRSAQRAQELVLYDFLARLYRGQLARGGERRSR